MRSLRPKKVPRPRTKAPCSEADLRRLYLMEGLSMKDIAVRLKCSLHKVSYWMEYYTIPKRSISEAIYVRSNPGGDPFVFHSPKTIDEAKLFGLGLGLYWGEGTKADKNTVRLGNTDPKLILKFIEFLERIFGVRRADMRFGLQVFSDMSPATALDFWCKNLTITRRQFYKVTVTRSGSIGTYRKKSRYGVLTVYYHNKKLRDRLIGEVPM